MIAFLVYLAAAVIFGATALGAHIGHWLELGLALIALGLAIQTAPRFTRSP